MKKLLFLFMAMVFSLSIMATESIKLTEKNSVSLRDTVHGQSVAKAIQELSKLESNDEPVIYLILDTPGGSVFAGLDLINHLKTYSKPVHTITSFAASMGFQIAQGNPGLRYISPTGVLMSHPMSGGMGGEMGDNMSLDRRHGFIKEIIDTMDKEVVARTNGKQTLEAYKKEYDNELWTTGSKAVDSGYADAVTPFGCSPELSNATEKYEFRDYLGQIFSLQIKYELSKCPLINSVLRYEIAIVDVLNEVKIVLSSEGYDSISSTKSVSEAQAEEKAHQQTMRSGKSSPKNSTDDVPSQILEKALKSKNYIKLQFYLTRDYKAFREQSKESFDPKRF